MALSDITVRQAKPKDKPYKLTDGSGLYLLVNRAGKYWRYDYRFEAKRKTVAYGVYPVLTLAAARDVHLQTKRQLKGGIDPMAERQEERQVASLTFRKVAQQWREQWKIGKTTKHDADVWRRLEIDVFPAIGDKPVAELTTAHVRDCVKAIEQRGALDIAKRQLQKCSQIMRYAVAHDIAERNAWQVLRMLRGADGVSPLASLGQLRRYLTTTPLGQRAGYLTARRVLVVLRLTGWISLVGQQRDPMTGHVLSEQYQVHELALSFGQACERDTSLAQLLHESVDGDDNQVDRVAMHIRETLEQAPTESDDDDEPSAPMPSSQPDQGDAASDSAVSQQTGHAHRMPHEQGSTYKTYMYKKERTYRARAHEDSGSASSPMALPPCLSNAKTDQQKDVQAALRRLPPAHRQEVLDELQARSQSGTVRNVVAYFFALIKRVLAGEFRLWAGRKAEQPANPPQRPSASPAAAQLLDTHPEPPVQPASRETALAHLAHLRKTLNMPEHVGELAAQVVQAKGWRRRPA